MAYEDDEVGFNTGRPIELYKFTGTFNNYYLTSYSEPITSGSLDYTPATITRSKLKVATQDSSDNALEVVIPFDHPLALEYAYENIPPSLELEIIRCHQTDYSDTITLWVGRVTGFQVNGRECTLKVPSTFSVALQGNVPAPRFQAPCNHILYSSRCGVSPASHQETATVTAISGNVITVDALSFADNDCAAGVIIASGEQRMVVSNAGTSVTFTYPFANLQIGDEVIIRRGCDHAFDGDCKNKFNNGDNFGGFPLVPGKNPFTSSLQ